MPIVMIVENLTLKNCYAYTAVRQSLLILTCIAQFIKDF